MAQKAFDGMQKNLQTNSVDPISYTTSTYSKQNIFYNRFSIFLKSNSVKSDTIYIVDLNFDRYNNSINIEHVDKQTNQYFSKTLKFHPLSNQIKKSNIKPIYTIKNYLFNDTLLSLTIDNSTNILFTIDDTINPVILLHQFVSIDGTKRYELDKFRKSHLSPHLSHAKDYWEWYKADSIKQARDFIEKERIRVTEDLKYLRLKNLKADIDKEITKINDDKDSLIALLTINKRLISLKDTIADKSLHQVFVRKMDDVFTEYFNKANNINTEVSGSYKIYVNTDKTKRIIKAHTPEFIPSCFTEQFTAIDKVIDQLPLENEEISLCDDQTLKIIEERHTDRLDPLIKEARELSFPIDTLFMSALHTADLELRKICAEKIKMGTLYNYSYHIYFGTENQTWIFKGKRLTDSHDSLITNQDNILQFYVDYIKPKRGRYDVTLNTLTVNNRVFGPDLGLVKIKYKFITQVGFNVGTFIIAEEPGKEENNSVTASEGLNFSQGLWNVFLIHHHFGIFAGSTYDQGAAATSTIENYKEGGIYLAPGRGFFLKLGLAQYKESGISTVLKPLVGASLIFPVFHLEGGYNFALDYPYIMAGFNIPFNR